MSGISPPPSPPNQPPDFQYDANPRYKNPPNRSGRRRQPSDPDYDPFSQAVIDDLTKLALETPQPARKKVRVEKQASQTSGRAKGKYKATQKEGTKAPESRSRSMEDSGGLNHFDDGLGDAGLYGIPITDQSQELSDARQRVGDGNS
ncbi:MAG: hypothetical protein M1836_005711 [Candelina mexicana]|nr:MAG: hypothetical protein M1836_005711 [Candelina mexicana]